MSTLLPPAFTFGSSSASVRARQSTSAKRSRSEIRVTYIDGGGASPGWYWQSQGSPVGPFATANQALADASPDVWERLLGERQP